MPTNSSALSVISSHLEKFASCPTPKTNGSSSFRSLIPGEIDANLAANAKLVLMTTISFHKAESATSQAFNNALKSKYITLNSNSPSSSSPSSASASVSEKSPNNADMTTPEKPRRVLYPPDRIKLQWCRPVPVGAGLINCGNTCFLNSTLQALTHTAPLYNYLVSEQHVQNCRIGGFCMLCEMERLMVRCYGSTSRAIEPESILRKLSVIAKHLRLGRQEDAHEFLRFAVDKMQQACLHGYQKADSEVKETTAMNAIFGGSIKSTVICSACRVPSEKIDPIMDLCLELKHASSLQQALEHFIKPETLAGDNAYKCPTCKKPQPARKMLSINKAPIVLTCQLKRFGIGFSLFGGAKITKPIEFYENFNMRNFMSNKNGPDIPYSLYAIVVHEGQSANSGHYYAYVKHNQQWYMMNDSTVKSASVRQVLTSQAYLLFYIRDLSSEAKSGTETTPTNAHIAKTPASASKIVTTTPVNNQPTKIPQSAPPIKMVIRLENKTSAKITSYTSHPLIAKRPAQNNNPAPVVVTPKVTATRPLVEFSPSSSDDDDSRLVIDEQPTHSSQASGVSRRSTRESSPVSSKPESDREDHGAAAIPSDSEMSAKKRKKKHRKRKRTEEDGELEENGSNSQDSHQESDRRGKKGKKKRHHHSSEEESKSEQNEDEEWIEKPAPCPSNDNPAFPLPTTYTHMSNGTPTAFGLGRHVASWDGGLNSIDSSAQNESASHLPGNERWKREFDDELDVGRAKKIKTKSEQFDCQLPSDYPRHEQHSGNAFQAVQNARYNTPGPACGSRPHSRRSSPSEPMPNGHHNPHHHYNHNTQHNSTNYRGQHGGGHHQKFRQNGNHHYGHHGNNNHDDGSYHSNGIHHHHHSFRGGGKPFGRRNPPYQSHSAPRMQNGGGNWSRPGGGAGGGRGGGGQFRRQFSLPFQH